MKLLRLKPGHGEIVLAEGDVEIPEQERELIEAFRRELDAGMWAAVPTETRGGRREAELVRRVVVLSERHAFFPNEVSERQVSELSRKLDELRAQIDSVRAELPPRRAP